MFYNDKSLFARSKVLPQFLQVMSLKLFKVSDKEYKVISVLGNH